MRAMNTRKVGADFFISPLYFSFSFIFPPICFAGCPAHAGVSRSAVGSCTRATFLPPLSTKMGREVLSDSCMTKICLGNLRYLLQYPDFLLCTFFCLTQKHLLWFFFSLQNCAHAVVSPGSPWPFEPTRQFRSCITEDAQPCRIF